MAKIYEIVIFTASEESYALPLISKLDAEDRISHIRTRNHCTEIDDLLLKDISKLGRDLKDVIIVDNSPH